MTLRYCSYHLGFNNNNVQFTSEGVAVKGEDTFNYLHTIFNNSNIHDFFYINAILKSLVHVLYAVTMM